MSAGLAAIVSDIRYDKYGNRTYIRYGNGAANEYGYDERSLQLVRLRSLDADGASMQDIRYTYDDVYNITEINAGGEYPYNYTYQYDMLNRLVSSEGRSNVDGCAPRYEFNMTYSPAGRILDYKLMGKNFEDGRLNDISVRREYSYDDASHPHAPTKIDADISGPEDYLWDANGNINRIVGHRRPSTRALYFNDEDRLAAISDRLVDGVAIGSGIVSGPASVYLYSADGERVWKFTGVATVTYRSGSITDSDLEFDKTFYPTEHMTLDKRYLYKHYFIGGERISTMVMQFRRTGDPSPVGFLHRDDRTFAEGFNLAIKHSLIPVGYEGRFVVDPVFNSIEGNSSERYRTFYYHYTHQGSVAALTNDRGRLYQHLQYLPYGGAFVEWHDRMSRVSYLSIYTFSAKEKDSESGYNYFGARYYTDNIMMWLSVDPMSDERPWISPYNYCQWNPVGRVDTWGALDDWYKTANGEIMYKEEMHSAEEMKAMGIQGTYLGKTYKEGSTYYSLFGDKASLKDCDENGFCVGKLYEKIDEAIKKCYGFANNHKQDPWDSEVHYEETTDFAGIAKYRTSFGVGDNNIHTFTYGVGKDGKNGVKGYFQVFGDSSAMKGRFGWGNGRYNSHKDFGFGVMDPGYDLKIHRPNSDQNIVTLVFPDANSRIKFINRISKEFPKK